MYGGHAIIITNNKKFRDVLKTTHFMVAQAYSGLSPVPGLTFIHFILYLHILVPVNSVRANELLENEPQWVSHLLF